VDRRAAPSHRTHKCSRYMASLQKQSKGSVRAADVA